MSMDKNRTIYIFSLLVLAILLVLFAQGVFSGLYSGQGKPVAEITRIDLYDDFIGNYSKVSVMVANNDSISHNFSIYTYFDEKQKDGFNITVKSGKTFTYQTEVLYDKVPISDNETINSTLKVAKFVIYLDEQAKPFEESSFVFRK